MNDSVFVVYIEDKDTNTKSIDRAFSDKETAHDYCIENYDYSEKRLYNYVEVPCDIPIVDTFRRWPPSRVDSGIDFEI